MFIKMIEIFYVLAGFDISFDEFKEIMDLITRKHVLCPTQRFAGLPTINFTINCYVFFRFNKTFI